MNLIQAYGHGIEMGPKEHLPETIQWMPPGKSTITTRSADGEPATRDIDVTEELAARVRDMFRVILEKAKSGDGDLPYIDFNHDDGEAAAHPVEMFWGGDDPRKGGIRAKLTWTSAGKEAIAGRTFRRFSPEFYVDDQNQVVALGANLGGLVNRAAFKNIEPIWARGAGPSTQQPTNTMTDTEKKQLADLTTAIATLTTDLTSIKAKLAEKPAAAPASGDTATKVAAGAVDPTVLVLQTEVATLKEARQADNKREAERIVAKAIEDGRIPAQNKEVTDKWVALIQVDARNADLIPAANPALVRITAANGAGQTAGTGAATGEHPFLVKAREYAAANKLGPAEGPVEFARTAEGRALYGQYLAAMKGVR